MANTLTIRSPNYYKPFDNSDNPCCWQVDLVCRDVEAVLDGAGFDYESMIEDWGAAYSWTNSDGVEHSLMISCVDVENAEYEIQCSAIRKRLLGLRREDVTEASDFVQIRPFLLKLDKAYPEAPPPDVRL
ncbi:hypothetical protein OKA05_03365 [Luteolibacter arcticus]|uniref:Uncharacterized protein n=1 Tax=Luteolibacter arcticus TaxID=1581411 RepID=A0ABT3GD84_9BACT|nr:hypothetical protein [Luteolibacter arcticus]MCW1921577.1 hypothetical protein [Luteolibacter arcticus]